VLPRRCLASGVPGEERSYVVENGGFPRPLLAV